MRLVSISAILFGIAATFKHHAFFLLIFFLPYIFALKNRWPRAAARFLLVCIGTAGAISLPFILTAPAGFLRALSYVEVFVPHPVWGWNIWAALQDGWGLKPPVQVIWFIRLIGTMSTAIIILSRKSWQRLWKTYLGAATTMFVYLVLSWWTTYAYFTFLIPLIGLTAIESTNHDGRRDL